MTLTETVRRSLDPDGFSTPTEYGFYWGFMGSTSDRCQYALIDNLEIRGDRRPEGVLRLTYAGVTTTLADGFVTGSDPETDPVCVSIATSFGDGYNSLGLGSMSSPKVRSAIWVALDPDTVGYLKTENSVNYVIVEYNTVDCVKISTQVLDESYHPVGMGVDVTNVWTNQENTIGTKKYIDLSGTMGVIMQAVSVVMVGAPASWSVLAQLLKFTWQSVYYFSGFSSDPGGSPSGWQKDLGACMLNSGTDPQTSTASGAIDYVSALSYPYSPTIKSGSTDLKLQLDVRPTFNQPGIYHVNVGYDIVLNHVFCKRLQQGQPFVWLQIVETPTTKHYEQGFDILYFPDGDRVHVLQMDASQNGNHLSPFSGSADTTDIKLTRNGQKWYVVSNKRAEENPSIRVDADSSFVDGRTWWFQEMLVSFLYGGYRQTNPAEYAGVSLPLILAKDCPFYRIGAIYK
jgi:hypothetical protein